MEVAVVGAGAAGLAMTRALRVAGHKATLLEKNTKVGGTWAYGTGRSAMYQSLRTNLPREVMGFWELPFDTNLAQEINRDTRRYCGHETVQAYLERYARTFDLERNLQLNTKVERCRPILDRWNCSWDQPATQGPQWEVKTVHEVTREERTKTYDALVICNGHYSEPNVPKVDGTGEFPGEQIHSHSYRENTAYAGKRVVVVGAMASGEDIAREVAQVANEVHLAARRFQNFVWAKESGPFGDRENIHKHPILKRLCNDKSVVFDDGSVLHGVDSIIWSTGYDVTFPFLDGCEDLGPNIVPRVVDNRVEHLFEHVFPPGSAPSLSFLGLLWKCVPFPMFELQAAWVTSVLSGQTQLPTRNEMLAAVKEFYAHLDQEGYPKRHTHMIGDDQWKYNDMLAKYSGCMHPLPKWRENLYRSQSNFRKTHPDDYRETYVDQDVLAEVEAWFASGRSIFATRS
eukprot:scaffold1997_cov318-Pavlova_lutheri.AAC.12